MKRIFAMITLVAILITAVSLVPASGEQTDAYIIGDADGNGVVALPDATLAQRVLASLDTDDDGMIGKRADIDGSGLDVTDVTLILRYIADIETGYPIGESSVTPPATEPSSGRDEYELPFVPKKR